MQNWPLSWIHLCVVKIPTVCGWICLKLLKWVHFSILSRFSVAHAPFSFPSIFPWLCLADIFCAFSSLSRVSLIFLVAKPDFSLNDECGLNLLYVPWLIHSSRWGSCSRPPVWLWALCLAVFPGQQCGPCELMYGCLSQEKEDTPLWREEQIWGWHDCKLGKL